MQKKKEQNNAQYPRVSKAIHNPTTPAPRVMTQSPTPSPRKYIHVIPPKPALPMTAQPHRKYKFNARLSVAQQPYCKQKYNTRLSVAQHGANAIIDRDIGHALEYRHLIKNPKYKQIWYHSMSNEIGRLTQGNSRIQETNTMFFITYNIIPQNRRKYVTYARIVVDYRPQKQEKERTRITVGRNIINYPNNVSAKIAEVTTVKILINSTISTPHARFCEFDIGNFYMGTPMSRYEYMFICLQDIRPDINQQYNLNTIAKDGKVYVEIRKDMYGLPQAGILANKLLQKILQSSGIINVNTHTACGNIPHDQLFLSLWLMILESNMLAKNISCTSSMYSKLFTTRFPLIGRANFFVASK